MSEIKKHAILIGINEVPNMDYLITPSAYAIQMKEWALSQGYGVSLFVDEPDGEISNNCSRMDILRKISELTRDGLDQLLIYFSGHGIERSAGNDIWLLPGYLDDPNESIDLALNKALANCLGVSHVIFISDACRAPSDSNALRVASGGAILPGADNANYDTVVDVMHSTWPGRASVDIRDERGRYISVYTDCLLECLNGAIPAVIKNLENITPGFPAVIPDILHKYLRSEVPRRMITAGRNPQHPGGDVSSRDPLFLSRFDKKSDDYFYPSIPDDSGSTISCAEKSIESKLNVYFKTAGDGGEEKLDRLIQNFREDYRSFHSLNRIEFNSTNLFITGLDKPVVHSNIETSWSPIARVRIGNHLHLAYQWRINTADLKARNQYLVGEQAGPNFVVNVLPHFNTHIVFEEDKLISVNYYPTRPHLYAETDFYENDIIRRKAIILLAAKNGIFQGSEELGNYIRRFKRLDPILGLFAAYAYFQKGNFQDVQSVFHYMLNDDNTVLFDVDMLNSLSAQNQESRELLIKALPALTEGWSYLKLFESHPFEKLMTQLGKGLWTNFNEDGLDYLKNHFNYRKV